MTELLFLLFHQTQLILLECQENPFLFLASNVEEIWEIKLEENLIFKWNRKEKKEKKMQTRKNSIFNKMEEEFGDMIMI